MFFFDLKFIIIILLTIIVYFLYREIIEIKYTVGFLLNNKKIVKKNNPNDILFDLEKETLKTEKLTEQANDNNTFLNRCVVKTIKIPLNLESFLNPFESVHNKNSTQIIELSSSNIEEITLSKNNSPEFNHNIENDFCVFSNDQKNFENDKNYFDEKPSCPNETIQKKTCLDEKHDNETTENNTDVKSYASSSHIEIYSNDSNADTSVKLNVCENVSNKSNVDHKNILKNLTKYKLPELQDFAIQFKLPKENNNKKKTRVELIEEIKNYLNKNI